jgi:hypothetical protein
MSTIKWKFNELDVQFVSPADKFDEHVYKFSNKFGVNKHKITILENGATNTPDPIESSDTSDLGTADLPKRTRTRSPKQETVQLSDVSGNVDESDSTSDDLANPTTDSSDSESSDGGSH